MLPAGAEKRGRFFMLNQWSSVVRSFMGHVRNSIFSYKKRAEKMQTKKIAISRSGNRATIKIKALGCKSRMLPLHYELILIRMTGFF